MSVSATIRANLNRLFDAVEAGERRGPANAMELADASGVGKTTIYAALNEAQAIRTDKLELIAQAYDLPVWVLLAPTFSATERIHALTEADFEREVQRRVQARWNALRKEIDGLTVADDEAGRPSAADPFAPGETAGAGQTRSAEARRKPTK